MKDIKQQEEMNKRLRDVKDPNGIYFISYLGQNEIKTLENFIQSEISLAVEQEKERMKNQIASIRGFHLMKQDTTKDEILDSLFDLINNK